MRPVTGARGHRVDVGAVGLFLVVSFAAAWLTKGRTIVAEIAVEILSVPREALAERIETLRHGHDRSRERSGERTESR